MKSFKLGVLVALSGLATAMSGHAGLVFTIENAGVQATTVPGVTTETFDSGSPGAFSGAIAMGTLSTGGAKVAPNFFGGSSASQYYAVGAQSGSTAATLTLTTPQNYLGMWWPAGDAQNRLEFYDGATLLASYRVADIVPFLSPAYYGNPNGGVNAGEPYVYLDFTTTGGSHITSVNFLNDSTGSGFEIDNISVTTDVITPPGNPIPDGGSTLALLGGTLAGIGALRRKLSA